MRISLLLLLSGLLHAAQSGKEIYQQYCIVCHASGLAGAPKFRAQNAWKARCEKKKLDGLVASAVKGLNAMPAKGTCQECKAYDIKAAIRYMVPNDEANCK